MLRYIKGVILLCRRCILTLLYVAGYHVRETFMAALYFRTVVRNWSKLQYCVPRLRNSVPTRGRRLLPYNGGRSSMNACNKRMNNACLFSIQSHWITCITILRSLFSLEPCLNWNTSCVFNVTMIGKVMAICYPSTSKCPFMAVPM